MDSNPRFQSLVISFMLDKPGVMPFNPHRLDESASGASHGERCVIQFLLNLWNSDIEWACGTFDALEALSVWDKGQRQPFLQWASNPWWP